MTKATHGITLAMYSTMDCYYMSLLSNQVIVAKLTSQIWYDWVESTVYYEIEIKTFIVQIQA